jgi:AcrR family transcriptional regulator
MALKKKKYQDLYRESLKLFATFGYKKTTIEDVADKLNMTKGNLYFYVKNKQILYENTINWALSKWQESVGKEIEKKNTPALKFRAMAEFSMAYIESNKPLRKLLINDPDIFTLEESRDRFPLANKAAIEIIKDILQQGIDDGSFYAVEVEETARYLFSVYMMFLIKTYVYLDRDTYKKMFYAALSLNLRGLTA